MQKKIDQLLKRLAFLGYCSVEIKAILQSATGMDSVDTLSQSQAVQVIEQLEMYESLGLQYLQTYSK